MQNGAQNNPDVAGRLLGSLETIAPPRNREQEAAKARYRYAAQASARE